MKTYLMAGVAALALATAGEAWAADRSAAWQAQIGDTSAVQTQAKGGAGITIGVVDTGIVATNSEVSGRVSTSASACAAVTFACSNGYVDDNGHGTAVAAIAAGKFNPLATTSMSGVAPAATIIADKSLNKIGTGYDSDVAKGITKATDAGAQVINLSLTYMPTTAVINAINYAAAHNVVVVWAGGNGAVNFNGGANSAGFTAAALQRMIFVGSVSSKNVLSTFSNKPGTASAYAGSTKVAYSQLWLMAPGEGIVAPATSFGSTVYGSWTGTSMSAPEVSGAVALLEGTWPVLIRNGTASAVLLSSATNLGASATYGVGLLNISKAFQPIGTTSIVTSTGETQTVTLLSGQVLTAGATGSMPGLKSELSHYTTFDGFERNFTSDLSGLVVTPRHGGGGGAAAAVSSAPTVTNRVGFADGGYMLVSQSAPRSAGDDFIAAASQVSGHFSPAYNRPTSYVAVVDGRGDMAATGQGVSGAAAFAEAAWGPGSPAASQSNDLGVSTALFGLASGGRMGALGVAAGSRLRFSAGWAETDPVLGLGNTGPTTHSFARAGMFGVSAKVTSGLMLGVSFGTLWEENAMLGATYQGDGVLSLGDRHRSRSTSLSAAMDLGGGRLLLADYAWADTSGSAPASGVLRDVSALHARAFGVSLVQQDAFKGGDRLTFSVSKPMRLTSGSASLAITTVDENGYSSTSFTRISLTPNGDETDLSLAYRVPVNQAVSLGTGLDLRQDAMNVRGQADGRAKLELSVRF